MHNLIKFYTQNKDGTYDVNIQNIILTEEQLRYIEENDGLPVEISFVDSQKMSSRQRGFIFALLSDIEKHTGQPREYMRHYFQDYVQFINGYEDIISLSNCSQSIATQIIDIILTFMFKYDIPINYKTSTLMRNDQSFLYLSTIKRKCIICGKNNADLAHHYHIGRGMNRNTMNHYGYEVLALCREHHNQQHQMGIRSFDEYFGITNAWLKVDERLNKMLKGQKGTF